MPQSTFASQFRLTLNAVVILATMTMNACRARSDSDIKSRPQGTSAKCQDTVLPLRDFKFKAKGLEIEFSADGETASYIPIAQGNFGTVAQVASVDAVNLGLICGVALTFNKGKSNEHSEYFTVEKNYSQLIAKKDGMILVRSVKPIQPQFD